LLEQRAHAFGEVTVGVVLQILLQFFDPLFVPALNEVEIGELNLRRREVPGIKRLGLPEVRLGLFKIPQPEVAFTQLRVGECVLGRPFDGPLVNLERLGILTNREKRAAQIDERPVGPRIFDERPPEVLFSRGEIACLVRDDPQLIPRLGVMRREIESAEEMPFRALDVILAQSLEGLLDLLPSLQA